VLDVTRTNKIQATTKESSFVQTGAT